MSEKKKTTPEQEIKETPKAAPKAPKPAINIDPQYLGRLTVTLLVICVIVAGLLGIVNAITAPIIQQANWEKTMKAMAEVLEAEDYVPMEDAQLPDKVSAIYTATTGGEAIGWVVEVSPNGFDGAIQMVVGVDLADCVTGVSIVNHGETPNVGTKVVEDPEVLARFEGMTIHSGEITVNKGDNKFDGVSGATVSSKGVTSGVNMALQAVAINRPLG